MVEIPRNVNLVECDFRLTSFTGLLMLLTETSKVGFNLFDQEMAHVFELFLFQTQPDKSHKSL